MRKYIKLRCPKCDKRKLRYYYNPIKEDIIQLVYHCKYCGWLKFEDFEGVVELPRRGGRLEPTLLQIYIHVMNISFFIYNHTWRHVLVWNSKRRKKHD